MKRLDRQFSDLDESNREIYLLLSLLPPPISLDTLCGITGLPPVQILQTVEELVKSGYLSRYMEKGAGYYHLSDFKAAKALLANLPREELFQAARRAIDGVYNCVPDGPRRWLRIAHIYQVSGLPAGHFDYLIKAGHYCVDLNLSMEAAVYYRMALDGMETATLGLEEQKEYIEAAIGLCTSRDNSLSPAIQRKYLTRALEYSSRVSDPAQKVKLRVLTAKTFLKTIKPDDAAEHLERARQLVEQYDLPNDVRLQVLLATCELLFWQGLIDKAIEQYESVIGSHENLPSDVETLKSCLKLGWGYGIAGETARGVGLIRAVRRKAVDLQAPDLERYANLIMVLVLADSGRISEAEEFLDEVFSTPEELLDNYVLWPGNGKRAFFAFRRGEYEKAYQYQHQAWENSKTLGTPHHQGPDNIEVMLGLEERGMVHPEWNFKTDSEMLLNWPDVYMQGVALRFRALKTLKEKGPLESVRDDLKKSMDLLTRAGAKIELSHARVLMARLLISEKKIPEAEELLKAAWDVFSKVNPDLYPKDLKTYLDQTSKNALWVESLLNVGNALSSIRTRKELLSRIITQAMRIAGAERGAIFLRQDGALEMVASRNIEAVEIVSEGFAEQMIFIEKVFGSGNETVRNAESFLPAEERTLSPLGWMGCFPIRVKTRVMGVIFVECQFSCPRLPEDETSLLRIISNQAAVALENMEAYEEVIDLNSNLEAETHFYREAFDSGSFNSQIIGRSDPLKKVLSLINQVAQSDTTVLITGETGVGKGMVAQAVHQNSDRASGPFIPVNVVSLSPELIASELFGHEKGAFTGASQTRKGRFELASEGTLFLDDIDAFSLDIQAKMLRVLETKEFERVGGTRTLTTRFRLVAASNRNIEELVEQGLFRSDFYYRLKVFPIKIPPLRERPDDIPVLAQYFLKMFGKKFGKPFDRISQKDLKTLISYHWPGNVRELRHVIERAVLLSSSGRLAIPPLDPTPAVGVDSSEKILPLKDMEALHIVKALSACRGKVSGPGGAAELLGVKPTTLYSKMKNLGVQREAYRIKKSVMR